MKKIVKILQPALKKWRNGFEKEISSSSAPFMVEPVYLLGGGSLLPGIKESIMELGGKTIKYLSVENLGVRNKSGLRFSARHVPSLMLAYCL